MTTTMMRVRTDIHALARQLAADEGVSMQDILQRALSNYRRARMFDLADQGYAALRAEPGAWAEELAEREAWDATLADGIDPEPVS
jgi:hypothetical protein